ncbi:hypothetical protein M9H77_18192 [Catharanthus roseus]|uniref:Uncharacterized protein n=1 Tax=Catharanthus roseus TaxID=4058 RepID=A0ACC0B6R3_CATRO|nr:hypothetical protein M9H77_18192 [Catharanthus roseus]
MGLLVAKQPNVIFSPINNGLPKVERSFRRNFSSSQSKHFLTVFLAFFLPKIEESSSGSATINHPQSPFDLGKSFQALKSMLCRREESDDSPTDFL